MASTPNLSPTDVALLRHLQNNARATNKELAGAVGIAESTCLERVRSLQQRGVVRGYHADVELAELGRTLRALISVRLQPKTATSVREFQHALIGEPEVLNVWTVSGADDFIVEVAVPGVDWLRTFLLERISSRDNVADTRTSLVFEHLDRKVIEPLEERA
jgi:DNA-binding Lrp family transcriptional regulator